MTREHAFAALLVFLSACSPRAVTQVTLIVDADDAVRSRVTHLRIVVRDIGAEGDSRLDETYPPDAFEWPASLALSPRDGDASRVYQVEISGQETRDPASTVVEAVIQSGYVAEQSISRRVELSAACLDVRCPAGESCVLGRCEPLSDGTTDAGTIDAGQLRDAGCSPPCGLPSVPNVPAELATPDPGPLQDLVISERVTVHGSGDRLGAWVRDDGTELRPSGIGVQAGVGFESIAQAEGEPEIAVFWVRSLTIEPLGVLVVAGGRAVVLLATGDVAIDGEIDAAADGAAAGPGGSGSGQGSGAGGEGGHDQDGAGGAGHGSSGGAGATIFSFGGAAGPAWGSLAEPLIGGSGGAAGGGDSSGVPLLARAGGGGGGAVEIVSLATLRVRGTIHAGGGGGVGAETSFGGAAGGGSGGMIVLVAPTVSVSGLVAANGGGGGGAEGDSGAGADGAPGLAPAAGGAGNARGGAGATETEAAGEGAPAIRLGAGGGGGVGRIHVIATTRDLSGTFSPAPREASP